MLGPKTLLKAYKGEKSEREREKEGVRKMAAAVVAADRWSLMNFVLKLPHATQRHMPHAPTRSHSFAP